MKNFYCLLNSFKCQLNISFSRIFTFLKLKGYNCHGKPIGKKVTRTRREVWINVHRIMSFVKLSQ